MPSCRFCLPVLSIVTTGSFCVPIAQCRLKRKGHIMKIKYAFLDGTTAEVEISDEIGAIIIDSRKAEHAQDERRRRHCYSYDAIDYEGEEYFLDTVDNSQINVLTQRTMHRICTAATNEEVSFAYRVAIPRQRFRWRNAFSTRWRSL